MVASTWDWLGADPALDLVNTVKRVGGRERDLLRTVADLDSWLDAAALPAPRPSTVDQKDLASVLALRDPALRLMRSVADRGSWDPDDADAINALLIRSPEVVLLGERPNQPRRQTVGATDSMTLLVARLATHVRDATQRDDLSFCDAPGCGQLFYRTRRNQEWCGDRCGNHARVARHQRAGRGR